MPVLTRVAACVPSSLRLARIADFRAHSGQLDTVGLPCRDFAMRARMRVLPAWPAITAAGPTSIQVPEESPPSAPAASSLSTARPSHWRHPPDWPVALSGRRWDEYTHRRSHLLAWQAALRQFEPSFLCVIERKDSAMLGFVAAVIFFIAFLINATSTATSAVFSPMSLLLVGLICLALHLSGVGTGWAIPGRRGRR